ncbi:MAG: hypothetical protein JWN86_4657 [Planctomycetota bacterium]|nr:hypothetical protein [Planctomycetota bacterium]
MRDSETPAVGRRPDLLGWLALIWAVVFGLMYAEMIVRSRAPGLLAAVRRAVMG